MACCETGSKLLGAENPLRGLPITPATSLVAAAHTRARCRVPLPETTPLPATFLPEEEDGCAAPSLNLPHLGHERHSRPPTESASKRRDRLLARRNWPPDAGIGVNSQDSAYKPKIGGQSPAASRGEERGALLALQNISFFFVFLR
ncbi:hypothetical protein COCNU_02G015700 [Cocos nucifera]|uniref:Uncharacterized protein n=1 Tax=Cocos nucifera TaxID=13894 RepID=A0A8K0I0Y9_COCNU|nr:hypothetical protein COCNU_02G015700 [Cocos nucifera]